MRYFLIIFSFIVSIFGVYLESKLKKGLGKLIATLGIISSVYLGFQSEISNNKAAKISQKQKNEILELKEKTIILEINKRNIIENMEVKWSFELDRPISRKQIKLIHEKDKSGIYFNYTGLQVRFPDNRRFKKISKTNIFSQSFGSTAIELRSSFINGTKISNLFENIYNFRVDTNYLFRLAPRILRAKVEFIFNPLSKHKKIVVLECDKINCDFHVSKKFTKFGEFYSFSFGTKGFDRALSEFINI